MSTMKARRPLGVIHHSDSSKPSSSNSGGSSGGGSFSGANRSVTKKPLSSSSSSSSSSSASAGGGTTSKHSHGASASASAGVLNSLDPWAANPAAAAAAAAAGDGEITVEQFLEEQCTVILDDIRRHATHLTQKLRKEHETGVAQIKSMMLQASVPVKSGGESAGGAKTAAAAADTVPPCPSPRTCVTLKCMTGPHVGQKFRLVPPAGKQEDSFKIGRSTSKLFKEKGLSLYKDKEVSTAHGKVDIRNGAAFFVDTKSTNGTSLNGKMVESQQPIRLKEGDVLSVGGTELSVAISELDEAEAEAEAAAAAAAGAGAGTEDENFASV